MHYIGIKIWKNESFYHFFYFGSKNKGPIYYLNLNNSRGWMHAHFLKIGWGEAHLTLLSTVRLCL